VIKNILLLTFLLASISYALAGEVRLPVGSSATISPGETTTVFCEAGDGGSTGGGVTKFYSCNNTCNNRTIYGGVFLVTELLNSRGEVIRTACAQYSDSKQCHRDVTRLNRGW
jgi:hypothetical protein